MEFNETIQTSGMVQVPFGEPTQRSGMVQVAFYADYPEVGYSLGSV